jgi:hypothetical protein
MRYWAYYIKLTIFNNYILFKWENLLKKNLETDNSINNNKDMPIGISERDFLLIEGSLLLCEFRDPIHFNRNDIMQGNLFI